MKKQSQLRTTIKKLNLSKRTISNLKSSEMNSLVGAGHGSHGACGDGHTKNGNTCPGHNTCYKN